MQGTVYQGPSGSHPGTPWESPEPTSLGESLRWGNMSPPGKTPLSAPPHPQSKCCQKDKAIKGETGETLTALSWECGGGVGGGGGYNTSRSPTRQKVNCTLVLRNCNKWGRSCPPKTSPPSRFQGHPGCSWVDGSPGTGWHRLTAWAFPHHHTEVTLVWRHSRARRINLATKFRDRPLRGRRRGRGPGVH